MNKFYYGSGKCYIDSKNVRAIEIKCRNSLVVKDMTSNSFCLINRNKKIIIFPLNSGYLTDLFEYSGNLYVEKINAVDSNYEYIDLKICKITDYPEYIQTNIEQSNDKIEDLKKSMYSGKQITAIKTLNSLHTKKENCTFFLENGDLYEGYFHIHLENNMVMTEKFHTENSKVLYYSNLKATKNNILIPVEALRKKHIVNNSKFRLLK